MLVDVQSKEGGRICAIAHQDGAGFSSGYWKYHFPRKWFKQAKAVGNINNVKANLLFDSGAEVSIVDTTFACKVGCVIDEIRGKSVSELEKALT